MKKIKVVVFTSGPSSDPAVEELICCLDHHPEIEFIACFHQTNRERKFGVLQDLWRRRGLLAIPLLVQKGVQEIYRWARDWKGCYFRRKKTQALSHKMHYFPNIHAKDVLEEMQSLKPDLGLVYGAPILKPELFEIPKLGTLGIHHGELPKYRGKKTMFWAIYHGEKYAGVTIQKINKGVDTGEIIKEGKVRIGHRLPAMIWRELEALGLKLYLEAIIDYTQGKAQLHKQEGEKYPLCYDPKPKDILAFWKRYVTRLFISN